MMVFPGLEVGAQKFPGGGVMPVSVVIHEAIGCRDANTGEHRNTAVVQPWVHIIAIEIFYRDKHY